LIDVRTLFDENPDCEILTIFKKGGFSFSYYRQNRSWLYPQPHNWHSQKNRGRIGCFAWWFNEI